jgi:PST family polysaccharide transporter
MQADFYPRLSALSDDHPTMNRLVNAQTEVGLLLAVPGLLATLALAPWIIRIFYTEAFMPAADLLQWFILGSLGRVIAWPMSFIMIATENSRWFLVTETAFGLLHLGFIWFGLIYFGVEGVALAFFALYVLYVVAVYRVSRHLNQFSWSPETRKLIIGLLPIVALAFLAGRFMPLWPATGLGVALTVAASLLCLRGLVQRVGPGHQIVGLLLRIPGIKRLAGVR